MPDNVEKLGIEIDSMVKELASMRELVDQLRKIQENAGIAQGKMSEFQKQTEQLRGLRETFSGLKSAGMEMMAMGGGVLFGFKSMGQGFISAATDAEKYELTLTTLFKSAAKAKEELAWARKFEDVTPYALKDVIKGTVVFKSFGLDAKKYLGMAGDMAAAFGGDSATLQSAIMGVSKAMASGAGAMDILRESFGITGDQLKKFGWKGKNDLVGFRKALEQLLVERFGGAMDKLSRTLPAYLEGFRSYWTKFQEEVGKPLLEAITPEIAKLYAQVQKLWDAKEIQKWAAVAKDVFLGIYRSIRDTIKMVAEFTRPLVEFLSRHPEFARIGGKIMFIGSALMFGGGAALMFTGHVGSLLLNLVSLSHQISGAGGLVGGIGALKGLIAGVGGVLGPIALLGVSAFVGWKIGEAIGQLTGLNDWLQRTYENLSGIRQFNEDIASSMIWKKDLGNYQNLIKQLEKEGLSDRFFKEWRKTMGETMPPESIEEARRLIGSRIQTAEIKLGYKGTAELNETGMTAENIASYRKQLEKIDWFTAALKKEGWTAKFRDELKTVWAESFPALAMPKSQKDFLEQLRLQKSQLQTWIGMPAATGAAGGGVPEIPGVPTPPPGPEGYALTADTRPQIDNYYYTIHFERDSCQINTLDLTPEKFQAALFEFFKRQSLTPQTP